MKKKNKNANARSTVPSLCVFCTRSKCPFEEYPDVANAHEYCSQYSFIKQALKMKNVDLSIAMFKEVFSKTQALMLRN